MTEKSMPLTLRLDEKLARAVDEWRRREADLPNRQEAIRRLLEKGLAEEFAR